MPIPILAFATQPAPPSSPVSFILSRFRASDKTVDITGQSTESHFSDTSPFTTAVLGQIVLGERVRSTTWIVIAVAIGEITNMVADKSGRIVLKGSLAALGSAFGFTVFTVTLRWARASEMFPSVLLSSVFAIVVTVGICLFSGLSLALSLNNGAIPIPPKTTVLRSVPRFASYFDTA